MGKFRCIECNLGWMNRAQIVKHLRDQHAHLSLDRAKKEGVVVEVEGETCSEEAAKEGNKQDKSGDGGGGGTAAGTLVKNN